jgi:hypothetical protein
MERGGREERERGIDRAGDKEKDKRWKEREGGKTEDRKMGDEGDAAKHWTETSKLGQVSHQTPTKNGRRTHHSRLLAKSNPKDKITSGALLANLSRKT